MNKLPLISLMPFICSFVCFFIIAMRGYFLVRKLLSLVKRNDYEMWGYLTSASLPLVKYLVRENFIWYNPHRFDKFVRSGEFFNDSELEKYIRPYRKNKIITFICGVACVLSIPIMMALLHSSQ